MNNDAFIMSRKVLQQNKLNNNSSLIKNQQSKIIDNIDDFLIVHKISENGSNDIFNGESSDYYSKEFDEDEERRLFEEEQEAIIKKQLQMLQADERGKQALIAEIASLRQKQQEREKLLNIRQHALDIEKQRAKRIASLPPPLPKSVKDLLKKTDEHESKNTGVEMPEELTAVGIKLAELESDNKENIMDPEEQEAKRKMQEEWDIKAKKRFNEAIRKDRRKEEYANILKQIEAAELNNRREMARNITSDKAKTVPCPLSDKFQSSKHQVDMEDAAEKLFKQNLSKEHAIEDIEGYQDYYEDKFKNIDSDFETKMIDCVPDFVKENYEYLLEDESEFIGGKHFGGLDESESDSLNNAFIESPPYDESSEKIDQVIEHLDKLRSKLQSEYDHTLKPLLIASLEKPKKQQSDKAVETDNIKSPAEDKAVETDMSFQKKDILDSTLNLSSHGIMARKKRPFKPRLEPFCSVPHMHQREVHYPLSQATESEGLETGGWSSSSYCSLPSKHGYPTFSSSSDSPKCDICAAENQKLSSIDNDFPSVSPEEQTSIKVIKKDTVSLNTSKENSSSLSEYVQQLADKYLKPKPPLNSKRPYSDSDLPTYSKVKHTTSEKAFQKETVPKVISESAEREYKIKSKNTADTRDENVASASTEKSVTGEIINLKSQGKPKSQSDGLHKITSLSKTPVDVSEYDAEIERVRLIHQVLFQRFPRLNIDSSPPAVESSDTFKDRKLEDAPLTSAAKHHVYHELSTIQEVDSLLSDSLRASYPEIPVDVLQEVEKDETKSKIPNNSTEKLKVVSLIDSPDTKISEITKNIHFVPDTASSKTVFPSKVESKLLQTPSLDSLSTITSVSVQSSLSSPLTLLSKESTSSTISTPHSKILTSSLATNYTKYPFVTDSKKLSKYFENISDIKPDEFSYFESSIKQQSLPPSVSSGSSELSEFDTKISSGQKSASRSVSPLGSCFTSDNIATDTCVSTPVTGLVSGYISTGKLDSSSSDKFYPLTPHTYASTPDISNYTRKKLADLSKDKQAHLKADVTDNAEFQPLTPLSYIPSTPDISETSCEKIVKLQNDDENVQLKTNALVMGLISNMETSTTNSDNFYHLTPLTNSPSTSDIQAASSDRMFGQRYTDTLADFINNGKMSDNKSHDSYSVTSVTKIPSTPDGGPIIQSSNLTATEKNGQMSSAATESNVSLDSSHSVTLYTQTTTPKNIQSVENMRKTDVDKQKSTVVMPVSGYSSTTATSDSSNSRTIHSLTPHVSSPSKTPVHEKPVGVSSTESLSQNPSLVEDRKSFQPSPHSGILTHISGSTDKKQYFDSTSSSGSTKSLTSQSHFSSDNYNSNNSTESSASSSLTYPLTIRLNISLPKNEPPDFSYPSSNLCKQPLTTNQPKSPSKNLKIDKEKPLASPCKIERKQPSNETEVKNIANPCSSDYFIPNIHDFKVKRKHDKNDVKDNIISDFKVTKPKSEDKDKSQTTSEKSSCSDGVKTPISVLPEFANNRQKLIEENLRKVSKKLSEESSAKQLLIVSEAPYTLVKKQYASLQAISSSSSSENLSDMFTGSKIAYQSTPIKDFEETAQEVGILEEPELSLKDFTVTRQSVEIPRKNSSDDDALNDDAFEKDATVISSVTPTTPMQNPESIVTFDTPSLLSFLRHEISCAESSFLPVDNDKNNFTSTSESRMPNEKGKSPFQSETNYKQRTKRLWSNLEEVKKKKLADERKRIMALNREKAKEYAKRLTPKKKK